MSPPTNNQLSWPDLSKQTREEIDIFETELNRFLAGQMPEKVFLEFRLRHGVYGQRQDGTQMLRIKIPLGMLTANQCEVLADLSEEYADSISHITTRQDVQYHFVDILDTPNIMRRLASTGITTKEACGNTVRNVTCCPDAGVCTDEIFDVTPHAKAMAYFLLRHPDAQNFGRKFKISFSGCAQHHCGLARIHDIGAIAATREVDGETAEGFAVYVGGGLGAVPHQAQLYSDFVPADEMLPLAQAISRVFARLGEKNKRARARMKFLVANLGIDEFRKNIKEELARLPEDSLREQIMTEAHSQKEEPLKPPSELDLGAPGIDGNFRAWHRHNVRAQAQEGYSMVTVSLALGDLTANQLRGVGTISRKYIKDTIRATVPQNLLLRWVSNEDLPALYKDLEDLRLAAPLADSVADITACPGTDSCKLGIASSRGLAGVLHRQFTADAVSGEGMGDGDGGLRDDITIKISGCFNSCAQHHIANIGFFGTSKRKSGRVAPLFQVILGGTAENNADSYGLMVGKVPAHRAPEVIHKLTAIYDSEKEGSESFRDCMERLGKARIHEELEEFSEVGENEADFFDNRQPWEYIKEVGQGECAGEMVDQAEFMLDDAERLIFEASLHLEAEKTQDAAKVSFEGMVKAADGLLSTRGLLLSDNYDTQAEFQKHFIDTGEFHIGVAEYFAKAHGEGDADVTPERSRQRVEESNLFIEEAHVIYSRMAGSQVK
ncbi:MAG: nitrite/sulfite reductase [Planctomycetota bacterium]